MAVDYTSRIPPGPDLPAALSADDIRVQLDRILTSPGFVSSQRLCRFLRFVVERTLENDPGRLKEFSVALEVFDRNDSYDPSIDSIACRSPAVAGQAQGLL